MDEPCEIRPAPGKYLPDPLASGGSRISPRWGSQIQRWMSRAIIWPMFSQKFNEIKRSWTRGGTRPWISLRSLNVCVSSIELVCSIMYRKPGVRPSTQKYTKEIKLQEQDVTTMSWSFSVPVYVTYHRRMVCGMIGKGRLL